MACVFVICKACPSTRITYAPLFYEADGFLSAPFFPSFPGIAKLGAHLGLEYELTSAGPDLPYQAASVSPFSCPPDLHPHSCLLRVYRF